MTTMTLLATRRRLAAAVLLSTALGLTPASAVSAAPAAPAAPAARADGAQASSGAGERGDRGRADQVGKHRERLDRALERVLRKVGRKAAKLGDGVAQALAANVEADRAAVAAMGTRQELRGVRPENYHRLLNELRSVARLQDRLATAVAEAVADPAAAMEADTALLAVHGQLLALGATSPKGDLRTAKRALAEARALVEAAVPDDDDTHDDVQS